MAGMAYQQPSARRRVTRADEPRLICTGAHPPIMLPRATSTARRRKRARRRAADQQARVNALLEAMAALATLQGEPGRRRPGRSLASSTGIRAWRATSEPVTAA